MMQAVKLELQNHNGKRKKAGSKVSGLYNTAYMTLQKMEEHGEGNGSVDARGWAWGEN